MPFLSPNQQCQSTEGKSIRRQCHTECSDLKIFVEEKTEVGEDDPQLLPTIRVLELALEIPTQLVLSTYQTVNTTTAVMTSVKHSSTAQLPSFKIASKLT